MPLGGLDANNWRELLGEAHRRHLTPNEQTVIAKVALPHLQPEYEDVLCEPSSGEGVVSAPNRRMAWDDVGYQLHDRLRGVALR